MKFFEQMDEIEREAMLREAVAFNVSLEAMDESARLLLEEAARLRMQKVRATLKKAGDQTNE
ncbi:MAG: hypothetical protein C4527_27495 [Candidatus Omnitrophota bacterium]|jgi:hypothetical protein|nr:MAG: hypothetical protein C4527_27495 [Candidatus Omnitrophota bacterium]